MDTMGYEKAFWEKVVESADSLIVVLDTEGKVRLFNRKAREVTGYQARGVLGRSWVKTFVPPKYQARIQGIFDSLLRGKSVPQSAEYPILSKQGRNFSPKPELAGGDSSPTVHPLGQGDPGLLGDGPGKRKSCYPPMNEKCMISHPQINMDKIPRGAAVRSSPFCARTRLCPFLCETRC